MFGYIFYLGGCLVAAFIVTGIWVTMKPINHRDDMRSLRMAIVLFIVTASTPYAYTEVLTRQHNDELKEATIQGFEASELHGEMLHFKVVAFEPNKARVIAVGYELEDWGGTDRPILAMTLEKLEGVWEATSYYVVYSNRLAREGTTFPPYR